MNSPTPPNSSSQDPNGPSHDPNETGISGKASGARTGRAGNVYEDFEVGNVYRHSLGRTITTTDNSWFTQLTLNTNPIHFDHAYAAKTEWGKPLVNSTFVLALITGISVEDLSRNGVNLGWDNVRLPTPVFEGDTLYAQSKVLSHRASKSRPHQGIVRFETQGFNQDGVIVITYERTILVYRRDHIPERPTPVAILNE